jgi:hypothetical protein
MLTDDDMDREVSKRMLHAVKPNHLGMGFGTDVNSVRGVNNFPIYNDPRGVQSRAEPTMEPLLFNKNPRGDKYTIAEPKHTPAPTKAIHGLYSFSDDRSVSTQPKRRTGYYEPGCLQRVYGLPSHDLRIENFAAEEAGVVGITDIQMRDKQWRKDAQADAKVAGVADDDIFADPRMEAIINGG